jgi:hypothetical protein
MKIRSALFNFLMRALQVALSFAGFFVAGFTLGMSFDLSAQPFSTILGVIVLGFLATALHEAGHWLGARLGGMTVLQARVFAIDIQAMRHGVRARWVRGGKGQSWLGFVFAANPPNQPVRRAKLLFIAMGPLINLMIGGVCLACAAIAWPHGGVVLAFAAVNLAIGLANLVPTNKGMPSDGAQLLSWWRRPDEHSPDFAYSRLLALYVSGVDAAQLPATDMQTLARQPMPMPLVALSFRLAALQVVGDWDATLRLDDELKDLLDANPKALGPCAASIAIVRRELDFCRAMVHGDAGILNAPLLNRDIDWYSPTLAPRCHALQAALSGDGVAMEHYLAEAMIFAQNSQVRSFAPFEAALAPQIRACLRNPQDISTALYASGELQA